MKIRGGLLRSEERNLLWDKSGDCSVTINSWPHFSIANLRQGGRHGRFPSHAVADEDALLDAQLGEEVFQVIGHRLIGQHRAVRAVTMVTGIYSQHLTGQRTVRTLGTGGKRQQSGNKKTFLSAVSFFFFGSSSREWQHKQRLYCAHELMSFFKQAREQIIYQYLLQQYRLLRKCIKWLTAHWLIVRSHACFL